MSDNPFSPSWYRVADLRPRLRNHHRIIRHVYRDQVNYILADRLTGDVYRFSPAAFRFIGLMDGERSVQEILNILLLKDHPDIPGQEQVIEMLGQLHAMDAIICDVPPVTEELLLRRQKREQSQYLAQLKQSILFLRLPLFDPEKLLNICSPWFAFLSTRFFLFCLIGIFGLASLQFCFSFAELTSDMFDTLFTRHNLIILWLIYPLIKAGHELAHALAIKKWHGEVHEIGIMFMLLIPIPYVNGSASATFRDKWQRITVSGAGIMAELFLASIAMLLWPRMEPGLMKSIAFNVIMIGGVSTLLFNGNPLVRFDGYYVLSDLLELPNLAQRSRSYLSYLLFRHLFGIKEIKTPPGSAAEKRWYLLYGLASFFYRIAIYTSIFLVLTQRFSWIGAIFGIFAIGQLLLLPLLKTMSRLFTTPSYQAYRPRMVMICGGLTACLVVFLTIIPVPYATRTEGVVWPADDALVRMQTDGFVHQIAASPDSPVQKGAVLFECVNPQLAAEILRLESQVREYRARKNAAFATAPIEATIIAERLQELQERLAQKREDQGKLKINSPGEGRLIIPGTTGLQGRFMHQGELLGYVLRASNRVRLVVPQQDIDLITGNNIGIKIMVTSAPDITSAGKIETKNPQATISLPDRALGAEGGGRILTDPTDPKGLKMLTEMFQLDIILSEPIIDPYVGSRVFVSFHHHPEPLLTRWLRSIRQLFLSEFHG